MSNGSRPTVRATRPLPSFRMAVPPLKLGGLTVGSGTGSAGLAPGATAEPGRNSRQLTRWPSGLGGDDHLAHQGLRRAVTVQLGQVRPDPGGAPLLPTPRPPLPPPNPGP